MKRKNVTLQLLSKPSPIIFFISNGPILINKKENLKLQIYIKLLSSMLRRCNAILNTFSPFTFCCLYKFCLQTYLALSLFFSLLFWRSEYQRDIG
jgi:hypothetical protein